MMSKMREAITLVEALLEIEEQELNQMSKDEQCSTKGDDKETCISYLDDALSLLKSAAEYF